MITVTIETTLDALKGKFAKANAASKDNVRKSIAQLGKRWVMLSQSEAPKRSGMFRQTITTSPFENGDTIGFKGYSERPLGKWIIEGTKRHDIPLEHFTKTLVFFWKKLGMKTVVPKRGGFPATISNGVLYIGKGYVDHPGTKPNPFTERAFDRFVPEVEQAARRIAENWVVTFGEA